MAEVCSSKSIWHWSDSFVETGVESKATASNKSSSLLTRSSDILRGLGFERWRRANFGLFWALPDWGESLWLEAPFRPTRSGLWGEFKLCEDQLKLWGVKLVGKCFCFDWSRGEPAAPDPRGLCKSFRAVSWSMVNRSNLLKNIRH